MPPLISLERAARIRQLFEELSERPESERSAFLDRACGDDQSLRHELSSLLMHAESGAAGIDDVAHDVVAPVLKALREDFQGLSDLLDQATAQAKDGSSSWEGRRVSHFEVKESIGRGGMGEVYRAVDTRLNREVAVKVLLEIFTSDPERLTRFEREAKVLASLNHPNIGHIYGLEEAEGTKALVLELVEGPTLADRIAKGAIPIEEALTIARQIAEALEAAHESGIIHRDLKPANVKVGDDGTVKVLDFGLAKVFRAEPEGSEAQEPTLTAATRPGVVMGTAAYMSPEQAKGEPVDKRSDIWAFGCVLYEMLTGSRAFEGESVSEIVAGVIKGEPDWDALPVGLSPAILTLLRRCLQKDPKRRIRDIGDVQLRIEDAADGPAAPDAKLAVWQKPIPVAFLGLVLIALTCVAIWALSKGRLSTAPPKTTRLTITLPEGRERSGSLSVSPDGQTVVYRGTGGLFQRRIDQFESVPMPNTEGARAPFFSPDGQWVGFSSRRALRKVALAGGLSQELAEVGNNRGGTWGDDDTIVVVRAPTSLVQIPAAGGEPKVILEPEAGSGFLRLRYPQMLKGTGAILFTYGDFGKETFELQILLPGTGERRTILHNAIAGRVLPTGHLVFVRSGALWAVTFDRERLEVVGSPVTVIEGIHATTGRGTSYAIADAGTLVYEPGPIGSPSERTLVLLDRQGNEEALPVPPNRYQDIRFSPDGTRIAVQIKGEDGSDLFIYELSAKRLIPLTYDGGESPVWTPDGSHITFMAKDALWNIASDFSAEPRLLSALPEDSTITWLLSWSPDGRVLFLQRRATYKSRSVYQLSVLEDGSIKSLPLHDELNLRRRIYFSVDGRWFSYLSIESSLGGVYVQPFPPGAGPRRRIAQGYIHRPVWSGIGHELFYASSGEIWAVAIETEPTLQWQDPALLFDLPKSFTPGPFPYYDASPDGPRFVFIKRPGEEESGEIRVVLNWFEELKEKVPIP